LESGKLQSEVASRATREEADKLREFHRWLCKQFEGYKSALAQVISNDEEQLQAPAIRTFLEVSDDKHDYDDDDDNDHDDDDYDDR